MTAAVGNNWLVLVLSTVALASAVILADKSSEFVKGKNVRIYGSFVHEEASDFKSVIVAPEWQCKST